MRNKIPAASILLAVVLVSSAFAQTHATALAEDAQRAKQIVKVAEMALFRVESFINSTLQNTNVTARLESLGLVDSLNKNISLLGQAKSLLLEAKADLETGNYTGAIMEAMEAMRLCKDIFKNVHEILEQAGVKAESERPEIQAQGLLVAVNRSIERINRIKAVLPEDASDIRKLLDEASSLLNITKIKQLLSEGKVAEAAHILAEANKLIAQAFMLLKSKAEERLAERAEKFRVGIGRQIDEIAGKINTTELNEMLHELNFKTIDGLKDFVREIVNQAKEYLKAGKIGEALERLREISRKIKEFTKAYRARRLPSISENLSLNVNVEVSEGKHWTLVKVTVKNAGNVTIIFLNGAFGSIIEKNVDGKWIPYYSPISMQRVVKLKPDEEKSFLIKLLGLEAGQYRVIVHGFSEITMTPASASAEFIVS
jgi:tetratricopeptide (TPR) repeat protein